MMMAGNEKQEVIKSEKQEVAKPNSIGHAESRKRVVTRIRNRYAHIRATNSIPDWKFDDPDCKHEVQEVVDKEKKDSEDLILSLGATDDPVQCMLATQMAAVHDLQQILCAAARISNNGESLQKHISMFAKLSHVFIQQASLMHKLQGHHGEQKMRVEHVHVHPGGQAIVGTVTNGKGGGWKRRRLKITPCKRVINTCCHHDAGQGREGKHLVYPPQ